ncbi:MAG TPA: TPM domain-containing protein [Paucimonas sp.]|nr:TPM domain-containing protein [Paucimonas sp.]HJW56616.1 TPM domain-containing protein [Burkholderiaceae bacterium]
MKNITRALRHLATTTSTGRRAFPARTLEAIQAAIAAGEKQHRAEVRLIIEPALPMQMAAGGHSARERARELFSLYRIWDTEENCGILVYINLADHKVEIIADRAVGRALAAGDWQTVCKTMTQGFARGEFHDSAIAGLTQLNGLLAAKFPDDGARQNQLSNRPLIL